MAAAMNHTQTRFCLILVFFLFYFVVPVINSICIGTAALKLGWSTTIYSYKDAIQIFRFHLVILLWIDVADPSDLFMPAVSRSYYLRS